MENQIVSLSAELAEVLELGAVLGQSHAFGLVAGRCSAAQAQALRQLREEKKYKRCTPDWREFCAHYLKMSGAQVDRIIALLDEFGPGYFELSQLTRISPETYRVVEPVIRDGAIHFQGEAIDLDPENARKVAAAVARLRREASEKKPACREMESRIVSLNRRFNEIVAEMDDILKKGDENWAEFSATVRHMSETLRRLARETRA